MNGVSYRSPRKYLDTLEFFPFLYKTTILRKTTSIMTLELLPDCTEDSEEPRDTSESGTSVSAVGEFMSQNLKSSSYFLKEKLQEQVNVKVM